MGKKSATKRSLHNGENVSSENKQVADTEAQRIIEQGNKHFAKKEHLKALEAYDKALKASESQAERPLLHSNKAACYMMLQRYKEAINECSNALEVDPVYVRALTRRAKAYEAMGLYKQALTDIQKANKADSANPDTQEAEKRLKDLVSGKNKANGHLATNGIKKGTSKRSPQSMLVYTVKCELEGEVRLLHILGSLSYAELLEQILLKFPSAPPCALKYLDREGDLVTITDKNDVAKAMDECLQIAEKLSGSRDRANFQQYLPPVRLQLVPVGEGSVPEPPVEEKRQLEQLNQARKMLQQHQQSQQAKKAELEDQQAQEPYEIEQWLVEFANLFRDQLGVEPDRHLDLNNIGWEKLQTALDTAVMDDKAPELFDQAAERFQEVTAHGYLQWGNVHLCKAKRLIDKAAAEGKNLTEIAEAAEVFFAQAEDRYNEVIKTKRNYYDGFAALASLAFERGKLAAGFAASPLKPHEPAEKQEDIPEKPSKDGSILSKQEKEAEQKAKNEANVAASQENVKKALAKLTKEGVAKAKPLFDTAWKEFQNAIDEMPEEEKNKPLKPVPAGQEQNSPEDEANIWAHCLVMWGNLLYEYSQILAAVGDEWKPSLDTATNNFRTAGCPEADIRQALKNHTMKDQIDLGPEPEPVKGSDSGTELEEEKKVESDEKVKGLPDLKPRSKKKTGEE